MPEHEGWPSIKAVFPDYATLVKGHEGEARFSVVPGTDPPVCVLYTVRESDKTIAVLCIRTYRQNAS